MFVLIYNSLNTELRCLSSSHSGDVDVVMGISIIRDEGVTILIAGEFD